LSLEVFSCDPQVVSTTCFFFVHPRIQVVRNRIEVIGAVVISPVIWKALLGALKALLGLYFRLLCDCSGAIICTGKFFILQSGFSLL